MIINIHYPLPTTKIKRGPNLPNSLFMELFPVHSLAENDFPLDRASFPSIPLASQANDRASFSFLQAAADTTYS